MRRSILLPFVAFAFISAGPRAQDAALPDKTAFLSEVRKHLRDDRAVMSQYTYRQTTHKFRVDGAGSTIGEDVRVYEMYPSIEEDLSYKRLVSINGKPVSPVDLAREDAKHIRRVQDRVRALQAEGVSQKERRLRKEAEARRKEVQMMDEVITMFDLQLIRREPRAGTSTILVEFQPKPGYPPRTDMTKWLQKMKGRAWITETDYQTTRIEVETLQTISFGLGILARLNPGSTASFERQKLDGDTWLPTAARFTGNGRILLIKGFRVDTLNEFSEYKKLTAETLTTFTLPKPPQ